jgi:hypothetical protein
MNILDYCTTKELIEEIVQRQTFAGVILHSLQEAKGEQSLVHKGWDISYRNLPESQVAELLQLAVEHFKQLAENEE